MRPIKFRVWVFESDIKKGYMLDIYEKFEKDYNSNYYLVYEDFRDLEDGRCKFCIPLQFTGLLDKNCKEIYEGEILYNNDRREHCIVKYSQEKAMFIVKYLESNDEFTLWVSISNLYYSVGNLYENPELLEKKFAD